MSLRSLCTETADIKSKATAAASATNKGGHVVTYTTVYDDHPVSRPQQPSGGIRLEAMKRSLEVSDTFYTPDPVTVLSGYLLVWNSGNYLVQWAEDMGGQNRGYAIHTLKIG
jgi:hypothetical protein